MSQATKSPKQAEYHPNDLIFIQSRAEINLALVEEYAQMMADGVEFDPVEGVQRGGTMYEQDTRQIGTAPQLRLKARVLFGALALK
jgi:hypothetical protein